MNADNISDRNTNFSGPGAIEAVELEAIETITNADRQDISTES